MPRHYCLGSTMKIVGQKCGLASTQVKRVLDECMALVLKRSDQGHRVLLPPELKAALNKKTPPSTRAPPRITDIIKKILAPQVHDHRQ